MASIGFTYELSINVINSYCIKFDFKICFFPPTMEFLQELINLQHQETLKKVSEKILLREFEREKFITKYDKQNYRLLKVTNRKLPVRKRVNIEQLISTL